MRTKCEPKDALQELVRRIPLHKRKTVSSHVVCLQVALGLPKEDLCVDRRSLRRLLTDPGRLKFNESMQKTMSERKTRSVTWRGEAPILCTPKEAATLVKRPYHSLEIMLSKGRGTFHTTVDERLVTVTKIIE